MTNYTHEKTKYQHIQTQATDSPKLHEGIPGFPSCISKLIVVPSLNNEVEGAPLFPVQSRGHSNDSSVWVNL